MWSITLDLAHQLVAADPECAPCRQTGLSLAVVIAGLVGGGWLLGEAIGALRTRRIRKMAEGADTV
jgi:hypothetical protein